MSSSSNNQSADEIFSDESSFYGDEKETSRLEDLAESYDPEPYWSDIHPYLLSTIQHDRLAKPKSNNTENTLASGIPGSISRRNGRDADESISDFLSRLRPSKTKTSVAGQWIFAYPKNPEREEYDLSTFVSQGKDLLWAYENKQAALEAEHDKFGAKTKAGLTRKLNPLRRELDQDISKLARETGVISGKWMMFPTPDRVDKFWAAVAEATIEGDLGVAAKVATDDGLNKARLVAVYTRDTADKEDIKRVLEKLGHLGLVNEERPIYYKRDSYTYLDILANNPYGLKASMLSSKDVFAGKI